MESEAIKELTKKSLDRKFNNLFKEYLMEARRKYNEDIERTFQAYSDGRNFRNWKYILTGFQSDIPGSLDIICEYDNSLSDSPEEGIVAMKIRFLNKDEENFKALYYFSSGDIHKLSVELVNGEIVEGLEEFYF